MLDMTSLLWPSGFAFDEPDVRASGSFTVCGKTGEIRRRLSAHWRGKLD